MVTTEQLEEMRNKELKIVQMPIDSRMQDIGTQARFQIILGAITLRMTDG